MLNDKSVVVPEHWGANGQPKRTKTEMLAERRAALRPDLSYDLDGDGIVGNRDYVISKLYDLDRDGKLNADERKAALEAVQNVRKPRVSKPSLTVTRTCRALRASSFGTSNRRARTALSASSSAEACLWTARTSCP